KAERGQELLAPLAKQLRSWLMGGIRPLVVLRTAVQAERIASLLRGYALKVTVIDAAYGEPPATTETVEVRRGDLTRGFFAPVDRLALVTEEEIFGPRARRASPRSTGLSLAAAFASSLGELKIGELVVHQDHGIGLYKGLCKLDVRGV